MSDIDAPRRELADFIRLEQLGVGAFQAHVHQANHVGGVFGGCLLAQALRAAELTAPARVPHSLHAHFLRFARADQPVSYRVTSTRDGASFSTRQVTALQNGGQVLEAVVSLQVPEAGFEHESTWMRPPPAPESLPLLQEFAAAHADELPAIELDIINRFATGMEARIVNAEDFLLRRSAPRGGLWLRPAMTAGREPGSGYAVLAFLSDYLMPAACNLPHVRSTYDPGLLALSLDHVIWLHASAPRDDWVFYEIESPWAGGGRGLNFGRLYSRDGRLLATSAQEQVIRSRATVA
jgi:acyl-CoA thioesterase-2